ncbi:3-hydroxyacyl-CoA dehydrogenase family protein [Paracoccus sp. (in: a-proteobacteria)]|uniref:3-hydroxyacyl-CoA dehydrogenase family protein n=1 Tax=Paracoccus sp. TaxID=267 RepID=UPI0028AC35ED|nr:3-hydroxyacyl-CoA dehydrogenase family protein [Paracoccus sp. (in: a-proteobacteria)]
MAEGVATAQEVDAIHCLIEGTEAGPFRRMDGVGLDVVLDIEERYGAEYDDLPTGPRELLRSYVDEEVREPRPVAVSTMIGDQR